MTGAALSLIIPGLLAGILFSGAHAFAGLRLWDQGAILTALAIPQAAAVGGSIAILTGHDPLSTAAELWSLALSFAGAILLARFHTHRERAAAITYVVAAAAATLVLSRAPLETEHIKVMLAGNIAAVSLHMLLFIGAVYVLAAILLVRIDEAAYLTAAIAGLAVPIAGVLLVFCYLMILPVAAVLFSHSIGVRLAIGWTMGALVTAIGILLSFRLDLPTGATIVCTFGLALLLMAAVWAVMWRRSAAV